MSHPEWTQDWTAETMPHPGQTDQRLHRFLKPLHLWAIGVGLVISGDYFGWNYGLSKGGPIGMLIATVFVSIMYLCFVFSYTELATLIPHSGGPFAYVQRAFGPKLAFLTGMASLVEFIFAPPAIARAIGSYVHFRVPSMNLEAVAIGAFILFGLLNALGVAIAAQFELVVTVAATFELFLFFGLTAPSINTQVLLAQPLFPEGLTGIWGAIPFAIWFYLAIEGLAMSAEETKDPQKDIPKGYLAALGTLMTLAIGTLICSAGVLPWQELVKDDSPLPKVLAHVLSADHPMTHLMVYLGLFGLIASFHGIIMGYSRQVFALARGGFLPNFLAYLHPKLKTPIWAIFLPAIFGSGAVLLGRTDELITLSVLGALISYAMSVLAFFKLRMKFPQVKRSFKAPFYPYLPATALLFIFIAFLAVMSSALWLSFSLFLGMALIFLLGWPQIKRNRKARLKREFG